MIPNRDYGVLAPFNNPLQQGGANSTKYPQHANTPRPQEPASFFLLSPIPQLPGTATPQSPPAVRLMTDPAAPDTDTWENEGGMRECGPSSGVAARRPRRRTAVRRRGHSAPRRPAWRRSGAGGEVGRRRTALGDPA